MRKRVTLSFDPNVCSRCSCPIANAPAAYPRKRTCAPCRSALGRARKAKSRACNPERTRIQRRQDQERICAKTGRTYQTREEITSHNQPRWDKAAELFTGGASLKRIKRETGFSAQNVKHRAERNGWVRPPVVPAPPSMVQTHIRTYLEANPQAQGLAKDTIKYRARYAYDEKFRAREILRLHKKKNREANDRELLNDGSLTPRAICDMFANTKQCPYCGCGMRSEDKSLDHIWPRSKGGWHSVANALVCCKSCNAKKRDKTPDEWLTKVPDEFRHRVARLYATRLQPWLAA